MIYYPGDCLKCCLFKLKIFLFILAKFTKSFVYIFPCSFCLLIFCIIDIFIGNFFSHPRRPSPIFEVSVCLAISFFLCYFIMMSVHRMPFWEFAYLTVYLSVAVLWTVFTFFFFNLSIWSNITFKEGVKATREDTACPRISDPI